MNDKVKPKSVSRPKSNRKFTNNKALNDILNETVGGITKDDTSEQVENVKSDYRNLMNKEMFGTNEMGTVLSKGQSPNVAAQTVGNTGARPSKELAGVLNKDYSSVLKAMDQKAKEKRGM